MNKKVPLDLSILGAYATKPEDVKAFADVFVRQTAGDVEALGRACEAGDDRNWIEICHKIKGAASMAGAFILNDLCTQAQNLEMPSKRERRAILQQIENAFGEVKALMQAI